MLNGTERLSILSKEDLFSTSQLHLVLSEPLCLIIKLQLLVTKRLAYVFLENATDFSNKNNPTLIL
jgi:hypothetical protein